MNWDLLLEEAKWVVILFDQANMNKGIEEMGSRGEKLRDAVNDLRKVMTDHGIDPYQTMNPGGWSIGWPDNIHKPEQ